MDAIRLFGKIQKVREDKALRSQLVIGTWRAQVRGID